jgi:SAM-dependent methyltransferase
MTVSDPRTERNRHQWQRKSVLRAIYTDLYRRMAKVCVLGPTLEIGGGSGNFKAFAENVVSSDIAFAPWLDLVADAQSLPVAEHSLANIVMFDVLHHIEFPRRFFSEAVRALRAGGRIVMVEPAITPASWFFYRFVHPEPVRLADDPLADGVPQPGRDAFEANQAFPTLIAGRECARFAQLFPGLRLVTVEWLSLFAYPLSGGFEPWSAIPEGLVDPILKLESALAPVLGRLMGFRMLIVIEARSRSA